MPVIPREVAQDLIRKCNLGMWSESHSRDQARGLLSAISSYARLYGVKRFHNGTRVTTVRLKQFARLESMASLHVTMRMLSALGLRFRIERDPNPRAPEMRPPRRRAQVAAEVLRMELEDPTGERARQVILKDKRFRARRAKVQARYRQRQRHKS